MVLQTIMPDRDDDLDTGQAAERRGRKSYGPDATQEVKAKAIASALSSQSTLMQPHERVSLRDYDAVRDVAENYIALCQNSGVLPSILGLCSALGCTRQALYKSINSDPDSRVSHYIDMLRHSWAALRISIAERGVLDNATTIFLLKNSSLGFSDSPQEPPAPPSSPLPSSPEELAAVRQRYIDALPEPDEP